MCVPLRSGSAANLELAIQIIKNAIVPVNKILFAFWGAEELGLFGSSYFVETLSEEERKDIALNLNFDMIVRAFTESDLVFIVMLHAGVSQLQSNDIQWIRSKG